MSESHIKCFDCKFFLWFGWQGYKCSIKGCWDYNKFKQYEIGKRESENKCL